MSWKHLLGRNVTAEPPAKQELDDLRSIVIRSLQDAVTTGLSADARFVMAYDAARTWSLILAPVGRLPAANRRGALQHVFGPTRGRSDLYDAIDLF